MADIDLYYEEVEPESELLNRPDKTFMVKGQAGFLAVALALEVPIIGQKNSITSNSGLFHTASGLSAVSSSIWPFKPNTGYDFVNRVNNEWFDTKSFRETVTLNRFVTKRIASSTDTDGRDTGKLASITNEMRILANKSLRQCRTVISLFAVSWHEAEIHGRFWPQLLLEGAEHGHLGEYLQTKTLGFQSKAAIVLDIIEGLDFLHAHGVVHCDLKPANILVFKDEKSQSSEGLGLEAVTAKLCDFGCSVIISDYKGDRPFKARIGTFPWMSPELDLERPVPVKLLPKADIYSFGLVLGSIFMNGRTPFDGIPCEAILKMKQVDPESPHSAHSAILNDVKKFGNLDEFQESTINYITSAALRPDASTRPGWKVMHSILQTVLLSDLFGDPSDGSPSEESPSEGSPSDGCRTLEYTCDQAPCFSNKSSDDGPVSKNIPNTTTPQRSLNFDNSIVKSASKAFLSILAPTKFHGGKANPEAAPSQEVLAMEQIFLKSYRRLITIKPPKTSHSDDETDQSTEESDTEAIVTIPDVAYELSFRSIQLPRVAAEEILEDLKLQMKDKSIDIGRIAFELSGAHFNGHLADDFKLAIEYLTRAIILGNERAISCCINIFNAADQSIPDPAMKVIRKTMERCGLELVCRATMSFFPLQLLPRDDHGLILVKTWAQHYKDDYESFLKTDKRRSLNSSILLWALLTQSDVSPVPQSLDSFKSNNLSYSVDSSDKLQSDAIQTFMDEVMQLECLDRPNEHGFTLLQNAVCKGDLQMAQTLVERLHADVENYGNTPGWTPLWLSCLLGHYEIAMFLVQNNADPSCRDHAQGITILHLLTQLSNESQIEEVAQAAFNAEVDINTTMENGFTPLFAALLVWDYSNGAAIKFLLDHGADPTHEVAADIDVMTPIGLAVQSLNCDLLQSMIEAAPREKLGSAKAQAFRWLASETKFRLMCIAGAGFQQRLTSTIQLIVDPDMCRVFRESKLVESHISPFHAATITGRAHLVQALFTALPDIQVSESRGPGKGQWLALNSAIEARSKECTKLIVQHGADILEKNDDGANALHKAAMHFPSVIPDLIDALKRLPVDSRDGKSLKEILEIPDKRGYTVFGLLVAEGYSTERSLAEKLRITYQLDYDSPTVMGHFTLTAYLIGLSATQRLIDTAQVRYLLNLSPPPRFECPNGQTLLHMAVATPMQNPSFYDATTAEIIKLILKKYAEYENLLKGPDGYTPLHRAAEASNIPALELLRDHVKHQFPDRSVPYNALCRNHTVLDYAYLATENSYLERFQSESHEVWLNERTKRMSQNFAFKFFKMLREDGALHSQELKGAYLLSQYSVASLVPLDKFREFLEDVTVRLCLGPWKYSSRPIVLDVNEDTDTGTERSSVAKSIASSSRLVSNVAKFRGFEFVWLYDHFCLRGYEIHVSPLCISEQIKAYIDRRKDESCYFGYASSGPLAPFETTQYSQTLPEMNRRVEWTRPGRTWTEAEVRVLLEQVTTEWTRVYGEREENCTGDYREVVIS